MLLLDAHMFLVTAHSYLQSCDVESIWTRIGMVDMTKTNIAIIGDAYLSGMWSSVYLRTNTKKTCL